LLVGKKRKLFSAFRSSPGTTARGRKTQGPKKELFNKRKALRGGSAIELRVEVTVERAFERKIKQKTLDEEERKPKRLHESSLSGKYRREMRGEESTNFLGSRKVKMGDLVAT